MLASVAMFLAVSNAVGLRMHGELVLVLGPDVLKG